MKGKVKFKTDDYVQKMIQTFPYKLKSTDIAIMSASNNLFEDGNGRTLGKSQHKGFHTMVAQAPILSNRVRPDIQPMIDVLATRVRLPNILYWKKLVRVLI